MKTKNKVTIFFLIWILFVAVAGGVVWFVDYKNNQKEEERVRIEKEAEVAKKEAAESRVFELNKEDQKVLDDLDAAIESATAYEELQD